MKITNLLHGKATGLIRLKGSLIDGKNDFYQLDFEHIKVNESKIEKVDELLLDEFRLKPFAEIKKQKIELNFNNENYLIEIDRGIINNLTLLEKITTTTNEKYCKFKGDFFSEISYLKIEQKTEVEEKEINTKLKSDQKSAPTKIESQKKGGCFSSNNNSEVQKEGGCFGGNRNVRGLRSFYNVNSNYVKEQQKVNSQKRKQYWSEQSKKRNDYLNSDFSPHRTLGNSFLNSLSLLIVILGFLITGFYAFNNSSSEDIYITIAVIIGFLFLIPLGWFISPFKSKFAGRIMRWIATILALIVLFISVSSILPNNDDYEYDRDREDDTEIIEDNLIEDEDGKDKEDSEEEKQKTEKVIKRSLKWNDFSNNSFNEEFKTSVSDYNDGKKYLDQLNIQYTGANFWTKLYYNVVKHESSKNKYIRKMYKDLAPIVENKKLNKRQKLDAIITSVQEIPYYLVHENSCSVDANRSSFSYDYHRSGQPCVSSKKFGLALPSEFSANFKGDCDTRSLFLYMFLKQLGYDTAILISEAYGHAILGVNIPGQGKYVKYKGKKYLTLETTSKGWKIGQLPPSCNDTRKWRVALN